MYGTDGDLPAPLASAPYWAVEVVSWVALLAAAVLVVLATTGVAR